MKPLARVMAVLLLCCAWSAPANERPARWWDERPTRYRLIVEFDVPSGHIPDAEMGDAFRDAAIAVSRLGEFKQVTFEGKHPTLGWPSKRCPPATPSSDSTPPRSHPHPE